MSKIKKLLGRLNEDSFEMPQPGEDNMLSSCGDDTVEPPEMLSGLMGLISGCSDGGEESSPHLTLAPGLGCADSTEYVGGEDKHGLLMDHFDSLKNAVDRYVNGEEESLGDIHRAALDVCDVVSDLMECDNGCD